MATNTTQRLTAASTGEAARFAGQPLILHHKLNRAMEELFFYRASGKHHNERESSIVKTHKEWRADAAELCMALRDAILAGLLEPQKPQRDDDE